MYVIIFFYNLCAKEEKIIENKEEKHYNYSFLSFQELR